MYKKNYYYILIIICSVFFLSGLQAEVFNTSEQELIYELLQKNDFDSTAVNFLKDWSSSTKFKIPTVIDILNNPFQFPEFVDQQKQIIGTKDLQLIVSKACRIVYENTTDQLDLSIDLNIIDTDDIFTYVVDSWGTINTTVNAAFSDLSEEEKQKLIHLAYLIPMESEDKVYYKEFFKKMELTEYDLEIEDYITIIEKVDLLKMSQAFMLSAKYFNDLVYKMQEVEFNNRKPITRNSEFGKLCIGTMNDDIYDNNYQFILDPGGNDSYRSDLNSNWINNSSWTIDLAGNDYYVNDHISGLFNAVWGITLHLDQAGNDVYRGNDHSLSASWGFCSVSDLSGDDIYETGLHSLAAATFGLALMQDQAGNDIYSVTEFGQGYAGTLAFGLLADHGGNDLYYAGGKYLHKPLAPLDYRSMSQGFGYGVRPDLAGGIGILYDSSGNDRYNGGVYSQAVAYWYALGIIIDEQGNDFYSAVYYPQGSGIHLAGGFLFDREGEDHYYSKHGPGQGAGHDYAVGFLIDRAGDDCYSVEGGNGLGLTNSVGVFLDASGNDRYERDISGSYGYANQARDSGGLGFFLDTGGEDHYASLVCGNDSSWVNGTYGFGLDTLLVVQTETVKEMAQEEAAKIDSLAAIAEIFAIASQWGVGSAAERVKKAGQILLNRETEAAEYIFTTQMATKSGLVYRALKKFVKNSSTFHEYVPSLLADEDSLCVKNTMSLIGDLDDSTYVDTLTKFVDAELYLKTALSALGRIKSRQSVDVLNNFRFEQPEKIRVITARGLKNIDSKYSKELLFEMENDDSFLIQTMIRLLKIELIKNEELE